MGYAEIVACVRASWSETVVAQAFRRACGITLAPVDTPQPREVEPSRFWKRMMTQRIGALDR